MPLYKMTSTARFNQTIKTGEIQAATGSIISFAGVANDIYCPTGCLPCNGQYVYKRDYEQLYNTLTTNSGINPWGVDLGTGLNLQFKLPDARGIFLRGQGSSGSYSDRAGVLYNGGIVGAFKLDALQQHKHAYADPGHTHALTWGGGAIGSFQQPAAGSFANGFFTPTPNVVSSTNATVEYAIAYPGWGSFDSSTQTQPSSISVWYVIKF